MQAPRGGGGCCPTMLLIAADMYEMIWKGSRGVRVSNCPSNGVEWGRGPKAADGCLRQSLHYGLEVGGGGEVSGFPYVRRVRAECDMRDECSGGRTFGHCFRYVLSQPARSSYRGMRAQ